MAEALHITLRKKLSNITNRSLSRLFQKDPETKAMNTDAVQRILLVRINYRIGNILFTTPLLNALEKKFPRAKIDVIIGAPFISSLIEGMPQVHKVYSFPRELLKHPMKVWALKKELTENQYDLLMTPSLMSTSDSLIALSVPAQYKVGFYAPDVFSPLTHTVPVPEDIEHEALKPLALMSLFGETQQDDRVSFLDIRLNEAEKKNAGKDIPPNAIGIFRDARNEKKIDDQWWRELLEILHQRDASLTFIDILDPNNTIPLNENMQTLSEKDLRLLAAKIANMDAFICGDTGPMHLASASGTATIALFKTTSPALYGTLGEHDLSLVMQERSIQEIAREILEHLEHLKHSA